jgi:Mg-chelatase subunit ChlD
MGLITFADEPNTDYEIDDVNYRFADAVEDIQPNGWTALWKSLELAKDRLAAYAVKYPNSKQRILVLSDGEDNRSDSWSWGSRNTPSEAARRVCETLQVSVLSLGPIFTI